MKNKLILPILIFSFVLLSSARCKKEPSLPEFYFQCKVDGQVYIPDGCTNCRVARLLGDTTFIVFGNNGYEHLSIGITKVDHIPISSEIYALNNNEQSGVYDNSPLINDIYKTDFQRTGVLQITSIDKTTQVVSGTFSFQAYNAVQDKTISITEGRFRLKYTDH